MKQLGLLLLTCLLLTSCKKTEYFVEVINHSEMDRTNEIVEVRCWNLPEIMGLQDLKKLVIDDEKGEEVPYQLIYQGADFADKLIFPVTVSAGQTVKYLLKKGTPKEVTPKVYGRLVAERKDDFAWENDKVAFRMYGPALQETGEISNGVDLWVKKTNQLVIDKWYKNDLAGIASYHEDHGEGLDFYKVGRTLGLGGLAPYLQDTLWLGKNFVSQKILDKGPLRLTFCLTYAPFEVDGHQVTETRTITLDAGAHLNKVVEHFDMDIQSMPVAAGIVLRPEAGGQTDFSADKGYMAYAEPYVKDKGVIYAGTISPASFKEIKKGCGHLLAIGDYMAKQGGYTYYTGGGWSQAGFASAQDWFDYIQREAQCIQNPLSTRIIRTESFGIGK